MTAPHEYDVDEFKRKYPHLYKEISEGIAPSLRLRVSFDPWRGYIPTPVDYIRRCKTVEEAKEVLDYLLSRKEISEAEYAQLMDTLMKGGIEAFGGRKPDNYYYKAAVEIIRKLLKEETS